MKQNEPILSNDVDENSSSDDVDENASSCLSVNEQSELVMSAYQLIYDTISENPLLYTKPTFSAIVTGIIFETLSTQLIDIVHKIPNNKVKCLHTENNYSSEEDVPENLIGNAIADAFELFYIHHGPRRESGNTHIIQVPESHIMKKKIAYLESVPQPNQRTDEWYHFRHKFLTASSLWKVFSTESGRNNLIYNKCAPLNTAKYKSFSLDSPMHWGNKYEPVSILWYEHTYDTKISDFGCIPHAKIEFIAASPDGINTCPNSERYGRMLEVKNIVNREITGIPKLEYWIQMQIQMEVCELEECDFLETRFIEYEDKEAFKKDGTFTHNSDDMLKGIIMHFAEDDNSPIYEYPPLYQTEEEFGIWENKMMEKYSTFTWIQNLYWKLEEISCVLVLRNKFWFDAVCPKLDEFWKIIQSEKINGYEHRAPKRRKKQTGAFQQLIPPKCNIDITKLLQQDDSPSEERKTKSNEICTKIPKAIDLKAIDLKQPTSISLNIETQTIANTVI